MERRKTYFASDFHLGISGRLPARERERQIVRWLEFIEPDAEAIYLVGDVFDFWFEYASVVPRGHTRVLGKLAALRDKGVPIYYFTGNHDMWVFSYFEKELDIPTYREPILREIHGKTFYIGHGDGLGPGDYGYKILKKVFAHPLSHWLFARLHPNFSFYLANYWSGRSRRANPGEKQFLGEENEWLLQYANEKLEEIAADYYIFGHRHLPIDHTLKDGQARYINLGEWVNFNSYAVFDGEKLQLGFFEQPSPVIYGNNSADYDAK